MKKAGNVSRKNLLSMGTCFGKMTKSGKFHLQITALDFMAPYAKVRTEFMMVVINQRHTLPDDINHFYVCAWYSVYIH